MWSLARRRSLPIPALRPGRGAARTRLVGATALAAFLAVLVAGPALGHSTLIATDPPDGSTLDTAPTTIRFEFSEVVSVALADFRLTDDRGHDWPALAVRRDPRSRAALVVDLPPLPRSGAFHIAWRVVDDSDLHVTSGSLVFGVGVAVAPSSPSALDPISPLEAVLRWVDTIAVAVAVGTLALIALALPASPGLRREAAHPDADLLYPRRRPPRRRMLLGLSATAALCAFATGVVAMVLQGTAAAGAGAGWDRILTTRFGEGWVVREAGLLALWGLAMVAAQRELERPAEDCGGTGRPDRRHAATFAVIVTVIALATAAAGHATIGAPAEEPIRVVAMAVHLVAVWAWLGGLIVLAAVVVPGLAHGSETRTEALASMRGFWRVAVPSLAAIAITGIYLSGQLVATVDAGVITLYGRALSLKLVLATIAMSLGLMNAVRLHRRGGPSRDGAGATRWPRPPVRSVRAEAVAALGVALVAALMASSPPARGPGLDPISSEAARPDQVMQAGDLLVIASIRPNRPGPAFIDLGVHDTRRPSPGTISGVQVTATTPDGTAVRRAATRVDRTTYQVSDWSVSMSGTWQLSVTISRNGLPDVVSSTPWVVPPAGPTGPVLVSNQPLAPILTPVAAVGGAAVVVLAVGLVMSQAMRRRARRVPAYSGTSLASTRVVNRRRSVGPLAGLALSIFLAAGVLPTVAVGPRGGHVATADVIDPALAAILDSVAPNDQIPVIVTLADQLDPRTLASAHGGPPDPSVAARLRSHADASQGALRALLGAAAARGEAGRVVPLWITNAISVDARAALIRVLAARPEVESIVADRLVSGPGTTPTAQVEANVALVGAPSLWSIGYDGAGVTVASLDTGVDPASPDLATRYRGGAGAWYDPYGQHGTPTDLSGHGTMTMGVMVGGSASGSSIGVAPGARWIASRIFNDSGVATTTGIHLAHQWALDPDGNALTADAPSVVNESWTLGSVGCDLHVRTGPPGPGGGRDRPRLRRGQLRTDGRVISEPREQPGCLRRRRRRRDRRCRLQLSRADRLWPGHERPLSDHRRARGRDPDHGQVRLVHRDLRDVDRGAVRRRSRRAAPPGRPPGDLGRAACSAA